MILLCLVVVIALAGCGLRKPEQPDTVHRAAQHELRQGNLKAALAQAEGGLAATAGQPQAEWHARFLLLKAEILIATGKPEEALKLLDRYEPREPAAPELLVRRKMNQGYARVRLAQYRESLRLLDEAYQLASQTSSAALMAEVENRRGEPLTKLYMTEAAEASYRNALRNAREGRDLYQEMAALGNLGQLRLFTQRYDEAIPWFEQLLPLAEKEAYRRFVAKTTHNIGICYMMLGDDNKALKLISSAEEIHRRNGDTVGRQGCLGDLGIVHSALRDYQSALSCYRRAHDLARQQKDLLYEADWLSRLASVSVDAGDLESAENYNRQAVKLLQNIGDRHRMVDTMIASARIAAGHGRFAEAGTLYEDVIRQAAGRVPTALLEAHARLGSLFARAAQWRKAEAQFQNLGEAIRETRSKLQRDEWKLTFQSSIVPFYEDYVDLLMERGRSTEALQAAESCRARVLAEKLSLNRKLAPRASAPFSHPQAGPGRTTVLLYWLAPRRSFLWAVAPGRTASFVLPPDGEIARLVEAYSRTILNVEDPQAVGNPTGEKLYDVLVAPAVELIPPGSNVVIVPDGSLHRLNFETLLVGRERSKYWIEGVDLSVTPSLEVFEAGGGGIGRGRASLLLMGSALSPGPDYPPLPDADLEVRNIERCFPASGRTVLTGEKAYPAAYQEADPGRFSLIHFSAHAVANFENPLDSAVVLSRKGDSYKLYARDVAATPLRAGLVTISACKSAGARFYSGEGLVGFAWAFLEAGAGNVIAGLWDVNDRSTALLMSRLYEHLANGRSPAAALRATKLEFLSNPVYRKPYYWAPFVLFTRAPSSRLEFATAMKR